MEICTVIITCSYVWLYINIFWNILSSTEKNAMLMVSTVAGAIINIILNFALIPIYGGFGAAIATVISYIVVTIVRVIDVRKNENSGSRNWLCGVIYCNVIISES